MRVTDFLLQAEARNPDGEALYFLGKIMTYKELGSCARRFAQALLALGVRKGDRVALMLPNLPQYVICYYGTLLAGAIAVQTNPMYAHHDLRHLLADSGAGTIVCLDLVYRRVAEVIRQVRPERIIVTGVGDFLPFPKNWLSSFSSRNPRPDYSREREEGRLYFLKKLLAAHEDRLPSADIDPREDVAVLQYTGGTTGLAKGVMLTHANLTANVLQCREWMQGGRKEDERILTVVPLFHVYGMTVCMNYGVSIGAALILLPKFDIQSMLRTIRAVRPTIFPGAPTLYTAIVHHPDIAKYDLTSIHSCISGSAPLSAELEERFERLTRGSIVEGYGLSEASPVTHVNPLNGRKAKGSIGIPWPDTDSRIVNDAGEEVPPGEIGELAVKGPQVMKGYWNQPEETAAVLKDGWLHTGDLAYMDPEGYFYIVDRKKDVILASGFNVYPREIEEVLYTHPAVLEAVVVGVPDAYRGETVKAFIVLKPGMKAGEAELGEFCRERLAAYKVPRIYEFRDSLPKSTVGKILRRVLAEEEKKRRQ
jgi:long-chain acyl-CoA synthetase